MTIAIRQRAVLEAVLLQTLAEHPDGLPTSVAYDAIADHYDFPAAWHREIPKTSGYEVLAQHGYTDWRDVPQERLAELVKTEPQWQNELRWARKELKAKGHSDPAAPRGLWRLTAAGMRAAGASTTAELAPEERRIATKRPVRRPSSSRALPAPAEVRPKASRDALLEKLDTLVTSMPLWDLKLLVDLARAVRARSLDDGEAGFASDEERRA